MKDTKIFFLLLVWWTALAKAKYIEGYLETMERWSFLARFCFLSQKGKLKFHFEFPSDFEPHNLLLYFDEADQWDAVYKSDKTCEEKQSPPHIRLENNQLIRLSVDEYWSGCHYLTENKANFTLVECSASRSFPSTRERWWFMALSRCEDTNNTVGLNVKYKLWMTNSDEDDFFFYHFSADEFFIAQALFAFLALTGMICVLTMFATVVLRSRQLFHTTYKMFMMSLVFEVFHLLFMCIAYGKYANDGRDVYGLKTTGRVFEAISVMTFLLMLILMAKGYTITRGRLSTSGSIKIAIFMTVYVIVYAVLFIYEAVFFDPGEVLYLYESPAGYGLIALRLIAWVWFCYAIFFTLKHYPEKSSFYYPFFVFYTIWFWATPTVIFIANWGMEKWMREKVVACVAVTITFLGYLYFLYVLCRHKGDNIDGSLQDDVVTTFELTL